MAGACIATRLWKDHFWVTTACVPAPLHSAHTVDTVPRRAAWPFVCTGLHALPSPTDSPASPTPQSTSSWCLCGVKWRWEFCAEVGSCVLGPVRPTSNARLPEHHPLRVEQGACCCVLRSVSRCCTLAAAGLCWCLVVLLAHRPIRWIGRGRIFTCWNCLYSPYTPLCSNFLSWP